MGVLGKLEIRKLLEDKILIIESLSPEKPFDPEKQITEDSIDLRLRFSGLRYKNNLKEIDTLFEKDINNCFETVELPITGYKLNPGQVLFSTTLEVVCLSTSKYTGRIFGRSTFARYGLSIHCTQPKFPPGIAWAFPLQLVNHNNMPIIVYPYSYIAQLQIENTYSEAISYEGKYDSSITVHPPIINRREIGAIDRSGNVRSLKVAFTRQEEKVKKVVEDFEKRELERTNKKSKNKSRVIMLEIILGALAAAFFGYFGNLLSSPIFDYWKSVTTVLSLVLGSLFLIFLLLVKFNSEPQ